MQLKSKLKNILRIVNFTFTLTQAVTSIGKETLYLRLANLRYERKDFSIARRISEMLNGLPMK